MIYGLEVRLSDPAGRSLLRGKFAPAPFCDLWSRTPSGEYDGALGAIFQSVLTQLEWDATTDSPWLRELRAATRRSGQLSIKFNVDRYISKPDATQFSTGRIVGTIGPAQAGEPRHLVLGRHLFGATGSPLNHAIAVLDAKAGKLRLDLGNTLPAAAIDGGLKNLGALSLRCGEQDCAEISYQEDGWYERTAGLVDLPAARRLSQKEQTLLRSHALELTLPDAAGKPAVALAEPEGGLYARADELVWRLSPGTRRRVMVHTTRFGRPCAGARIVAFHDSGALQQRGGPALGTPKAALKFPPVLIADAAGRARATLAASAPGAPRRYLDGQLYGVRFAIEETLSPAAAYPFPSGDVVSVRVWDAFRAAQPVSWAHTVRPIFASYKKIYPVMDRFLDLTSLREIRARCELLLHAFQLGEDDPNYMPVTRDLSPAKRAAIIRWLEQQRRLLPVRPVNSARAIPGARPPPQVAAAAFAQPLLVPAVDFTLALPAQAGGKTAALADHAGRAARFQK
jgi:hypothetical protein